MSTGSGSRLRAAEHALVDLEEMIARGEGDTDAADALREKYSDVRRALAASDRQMVAELAGDLDALSDREIADGADAPDAGAHLDAALRARDLPEFMRLLRSAPNAAPEWSKALWRGRGWSTLGCHYAAAAFLERAIALNPELPPGIRVLRLEELFRAGRLPLAISEARRFVSESGVHPVVRLAALAILYQETLTLPEPERAPRYEKLARDIEATLATAPGLAEQPGARTVVMRAYLIRAYACEHLDQIDEAAQAFDAAVATSPTNDVARIARGVFRAGRRDPGAEEDLQVAVDAGTAILTPYALLAFLAVDQGRHEEGIRLGYAALDRALAPQPRALVLETLAIAHVQMTPPRVEEARRLLTDAIRLAPDVERFRRNLAALSGDASVKVGLDRPSVLKEAQATSASAVAA